MNGRCETDPFDQARNVCGLCYGEFCLSCLMDVKGRKHPLCKECAIISSGVRAGAKPANRGPKGTAAARRAALKEAPLQESFQYFDTQTTAEAVATIDPSTDDETPDETAETPKRKRRAKAGAGGTTAAKKKSAKAKTAKKKGPSKGNSAKAETSSKAKATGTSKSSATKPAPEQADAAAADQQNPITSRPDAGNAADHEQNLPASAIDQLDSIRGSETTDSDADEPDAFRKPRPFIKPKSSGKAKATPTSDSPTQPMPIPVATSPGDTIDRTPTKSVEQAAPPAKAQPAAAKGRASKPVKPATAQDRPKPMARRQSKVQADAETKTSQAIPDSLKAPAAQTKPDARTADDEPSITSELRSPFSVAPPPPLPKRRSGPTAGQDAYERANPDGVETTPPGQPLARRRNDPKDAQTPKPVPVEPAGSQRSQSPDPGAVPGPKRRRTSDDSATTRASEEAESSERPEPTPMEPPAWTQRAHSRKDDEAEATPSGEPQSDMESGAAAQEHAAEGTSQLPKRRRTV